MTLVTQPLVFDKHVYAETPAILDTLFEQFELISVVAPVQPVTSQRMIYIASSEVAFLILIGLHYSKSSRLFILILPLLRKNTWLQVA